jgi:hypothetical protein
VREWSIGLLRGISPTDLNAFPGVVNPILTRADVSDVNAEFVADPFLVRSSSAWHVFFEVWDGHAARGKIGLAKSSDGRSWVYQGIVLDEPFHLSYPYVFFWEDSYFMIPESYQADCVRLYRASNFPTQWRYECALLKDGFFVDASPFWWQDLWWMFVETNAKRKSDTLRLFFAKQLHGPWREHRHSPVMKDAAGVRPAGRVTEWNGTPMRFGQDCQGSYGKAVRAFRINKLSPSDYAEQLLHPDPILAKGSEYWNSGGMHHIDIQFCSSAGTFVAMVDGWPGRKGLSSEPR